MKYIVLMMGTLFFILGCDLDPEPPLKISGVVTFTHYAATQNGLDYDNPTEKPIRGAVVQLRDASGTVLSSTNTTETGSYSLSGPETSALMVVIKAALGSPRSPYLRVIDNTDGGKTYAMGLDVTTFGSNLADQNFNADSGWDGTNYAGTRVAAPFAILDTVYQAESLVRAADTAITFPALKVNWSKDNKSVDGDISIGEISTTYFDGVENIYVLGSENNDTDEYDASVIAHEWSHYFEARLSRNDNVGGAHGLADILDPRIAFSEGFGNAFSGMVLNDPIYLDTNGLWQASIGVLADLDADSVVDTKMVTATDPTLIDGYYSEFSIQEVIYDLFDSGASDDDDLALGYKPIYEAMVGGHKTTPAFASIFSFLKVLKEGNPSENTAITALAAAENIGSGAGNEDEFQDLDDPIYTTIDVGGSTLVRDVDSVLLTTRETYGDISDTFSGNNLHNRRLFSFTVVSSGPYTIEVVGLDGGNVGFVLNEAGVKSKVNQNPADGIERLSKTLTAGRYSLSVFSFDRETAFTVRIF